MTEDNEMQDQEEFMKETSYESGTLTALVHEAVSGNLSEKSKEILAVMEEGYLGRSLEVGGDEVTELVDAMTEAVIKMSKMRRVAFGGFTVEAVAESSEFCEQCRVDVLQQLSESATSMQINNWKDQVTKAMGEYAKMERRRDAANDRATREGLAGYMIALIATGMAFIAASMGLLAPMIIALCAMLAGLIYAIIKASPHEAEAERLTRSLKRSKTDLRMKANRILPQLDSIERGLPKNPAVRASIQALRSQLEAIAIEEKMEEDEMKLKLAALEREKLQVARQQVAATLATKPLRA